MFEENLVPVELLNELFLQFIAGYLLRFLYGSYTPGAVSIIYRELPSKDDLVQSLTRN